MRLSRFFEAKLPDEGEHFAMNDENRRIALSVLRLTEGGEVELFNALGQVASARIVSLGRKEMVAEIIKKNTHKPIRPRITLIQGLPKGEKSSEVVQKGVECGISKIIFVEGDHAVARKGKGQAERWQRVAIEAMRQSGNPFLPIIEGPLPLEEALKNCDDTLRLLFDEAEEVRTIRDYLMEKPATIVVAVGPEGGWSENDRTLFRTARFSPISVGPYVLRTETAAIVAMSLLRALHVVDSSSL